MLPPQLHYERYQETISRLEKIDAELTHMNENQVALRLKTSIEISLLSFGIVGAGIALNPQILTNMGVVIGSIVMLTNALFFGYFAVLDQIDLNLQNVRRQQKKLKKDYEPYADAYQNWVANNMSEETEKILIAAREEYLRVRNSKETFHDLISKFAIGKSFFVIFAVGLLIFSAGVYSAIANSNSDEKQTISSNCKFCQLPYRKTFYRKF